MNRGILFGIGAYILWGIFPVYWKEFGDVDPFQVLAHRVFWTVVLLGFVIALRGTFGEIRSLSRRTVLRLLFAGSLLSVNWVIYIWAVNNDQIVAASLGYFMTPLLNVLLGVLVLRERLEAGQWAAIGVAFVGVAYMTVSVGSLPWIALALAGTFGIYALLKKQAKGTGAIESLAVEVTFVAIPAIVFLAVAAVTGSGAFTPSAPRISLLLALTGVATAVPLVLFGAAAKRIKLSTIGVLQYIAPTLQFLIGFFVYQEEVSGNELVAFSLVWLGLAIFTWEGFARHRRGIIAGTSRQKTGNLVASSKGQDA